MIKIEPVNIRKTIRHQQQHHPPRQSHILIICDVPVSSERLCLYLNKIIYFNISCSLARITLFLHKWVFSGNLIIFVFQELLCLKDLDSFRNDMQIGLPENLLAHIQDEFSKVGDDFGNIMHHFSYLVNSFQSGILLESYILLE